MPGSGAESWTLLGDDGAVVEPVERYLAYLAAIERSPNTVRAYAVSLKLWFEFLGWAKLSWSEVGIEDVARFVAWLRAPAPNVVVLADGAGVRRPATVNRYLAGVFGFYDHHARSGLGVAAELVAWRRVSRGSYKPFMHHVTKGRPIAVRPVKLHVPRQAPRTLEPEQDCRRAGRHRAPEGPVLVVVTGRNGHARRPGLGAAPLRLRLAPPGGAHRAPGQQRQPGPGQGALGRCGAGLGPLVRLYSEYMHTEYGEVDSDYVFVNLFAGRAGRPMAYSAVHKLIGRVGARAGVSFNAHMLRHSRATDMVRQGVPIEVVARLLTHRSSTTTSQTYVHLEAADIKNALLRAGFWQEDRGER